MLEIKNDNNNKAEVATTKYSWDTELEKKWRIKWDFWKSHI